MIRRLLAPALGVGMALAAPLASAGLIFQATLDASQEVANPPVQSSASGFATLVLNDAQTALSINITINGIDFTGLQTADPLDDLRAAHIHAPAPPGANIGVVFGFVGNPFNDNNPNNGVVTPFVNSVGGTIFTQWDLNEGNNTTLAAQLGNIIAGLSYINFHTVEFASGEIRGQILLVPEPTTAALLGLGLAGLAAIRRRRS